MAKCCVCKHRSEKDSCKFLKFRKSPGMRRKWQRGLKLQNSPGQKLVCACHFPNQDSSRTPEAPKTPLRPLTHSTPAPAGPRGKARRGLFTPICQDHGYADLSEVTESSAVTSQDDIRWDEMSLIESETCIDFNKQQDSCDVNQSTEQVQVAAENNDNIVFSESSNRSPWKVAPLKLSEQVQHVQTILEQAQNVELKIKEREENFKLKLEKAENDFKLKLGKGEDDFKLKQKKAEDNFNLQLRVLSSKVNELEKKLKQQSEDLDLYSQISTALKNEKSIYKKQLQAAEERHLFKNFVTEENISHYTGLPNLGTFYWLLGMVPAQLNYYFGSAVKCISREDQLFITLFKLRRNVTHQLLADLFKKVRRSMPEVFNMYPNCRMIFDCTEIEVEVPSLMSDQNQVYSSYKNRTTFKALIVIAPNGTIIYVSDLFPGSTSDKVVVYNCGVLDLLKAGDAVMADKGFPIQDILPPGVDLNLPPFKETPQFTRGQVFETLQIAKSRIHVERAILRVKYFHILDKIPHSLFQFASNVFQVCAGLTNLRLSLIKEVEDDMKS